MKDYSLESLLKDMDTFECDDNNTVIEESSIGRKKRIVKYLIQQSPRSFTSLSSVFFFRDDDTIEEAAEKAVKFMPEVSPPVDFSQSYVFYKPSKCKDKYIIIADTKASISSLYEDDEVMYISNNALYFKEKETREIKITCFVVFLAALITLLICSFYKQESKS